MAAAGLESTVLPVGPWDAEAFEANGTHPRAVLVADGLVLRELLLHDGGAAELLGPGDIVALDRSDEEVVPVAARWTVATPTRIVPLGRDLTDTLRAHPHLVAQLLGRAVEQTERQALHRAIVQLPRVEQRVLGLLWLLAQRWGRVGRDGVALPVKLTHQTLGRLVGTRRSTVTLALKALEAERALQRRDDGGWLLHPAALSPLEVTGDTSRTHLPSLLAAPDPGPATPPARVEHLAHEMEALRARIAVLHERRLSTQARSHEVLTRSRNTRHLVQAARERRAAERLSRAAPAPSAGSRR